MISKIKYDGSYYYVCEQTKTVRDHSYNALGSDFFRKLGFKDEQEAYVFFKKLKAKNESAKETCTQELMYELIRQNLCVNEETPLPRELSQDILSGVNYAVVKTRDVRGVLGLLDKVAQRHGLVYRKILINEVDKDPKVLRKLFQEPYLTLQRKGVRVIPYLVPHVV